MARSTLNFMSYNSTGLDKTKIDWIQDISKTCDIDILQLQEHFKASRSAETLFKTNFDKNLDSYVVPAYREPFQDSGRAKGGLAQLLKKDLNIKKERIQTKSWRLQTQILHFDHYKIIWFNCYMPTDPQTLLYDEAELLPILIEIENILENNSFDDCILAGDLNLDLSRGSGYAASLSDFLNRIGLTSVWEKFPIDFTHIHTDLKSFSTLDHFYVSQQLLDLVVDAGPVHLGDNPSRHSPIVMKLELGNLRSASGSNKSEITKIRKPAWYKAADEEKLDYTNLLHDKLAELEPPKCLDCNDVTCLHEDHSTNRDRHLLDIMCAIMEASHECIPLSSKPRPPGSRQNLPGWKENVLPAKRDSLFWHSVWLSAGKPTAGGLFHVMKWSRNKYHFSVRRVKRLASSLQARKLTAAADEGDMALMREMRDTLGRKNVEQAIPECLDGKVTHDSILDRFKECYEELYNSAGTEQAMATIREGLQNKIFDSKLQGQAEVQKVTGAIVKQACSRMRPGKTDVTGSYTSDVLLNAPDCLFDHLAAIFRSYLVHGTVSAQILCCAFLPLFKGGVKNPAIFDSYRAIAGASQILKLFEYVILIVWGDILGSDSMQFGFKSELSTTQCSWLVNEVANYFMRRGTAVTACLLDCSKAFDKCLFDKLFEKLIAKGLPSVVVRVLIFVYEQQQGWVKLGGKNSSPFRITNGTRQGSVISPVLFSVYLDDLLITLRKLQLGCHIGGWWFGAVGYADDLMLMAPNREVLQAMLEVCQQYSREHNLVFSTDPVPSKSKTKCMYFCGRVGNVKYPAPVQLEGKDLPWVEHADHLGHTLHQLVSMDKDCNRARARFIDRSVDIRQKFFFASPDQTLKIIRIMCCDGYGSMLWNLQSESSESFFKSWNTCVKLVHGVPRSTFTYLVEGFLAKDQTSLRNQVLSRYPGFLKNLQCSPSKEIRMLVGMIEDDPRSNTCRNIRYLRKLTNLDKAEKYSSCRIRKELPKRSVPESETWRLGLLAELMRAKQSKYIEVQDTTRITAMIESLCST